MKGLRAARCFPVDRALSTFYANPQTTRVCLHVEDGEMLRQIRYVRKFNEADTAHFYQSMALMAKHSIPTMMKNDKVMV